MKRKIRRLLPASLGILCMLLLCGGLAVVNSRYIQQQRNRAENMVQVFAGGVADSMNMDYNYTKILEVAILQNPEGNGGDTLAEIDSCPGVIKVQLYRDGELDLYQEAEVQGTGQRESFENYQYRLALLRKELVTYGPVWSEKYGKGIVMSILPVYLNLDTGQEVFWGFISVVLDAETVVAHFGLDRLESMGYDYELWYVSAETGHKSQVKASAKKGDFSTAVEANFNMPARWTLSLVPKNGWGIPRYFWMVLCSAALSGLVALTVHGILRRKDLEDAAVLAARRDVQTGLFNEEGLLHYLKENYKDKQLPAMFYAIELPDFHRLYCMMEKEQQEEWVASIVKKVNQYTKNRTVAARVSDSAYILVFDGQYQKAQREQLTREIEIDLMQCIYVDGRKYPVLPWLESVAFPEEVGDVMAAPEQALCRLWSRYSYENEKES